MQLESGWVTIEGPGGPGRGYLARTGAVDDPRPGILVIQEVWGVDAHLIDVVDRLAAAGYLAFAPDLYDRAGARPLALEAGRLARAKTFLNTIPPASWGDATSRETAIAKLPVAQADELTATFAAFMGPGHDSDRHMADLFAARQFLSAHPACRGHAVGSIGFCLGGHLCARLACADAGLAAAVVYYGQPPSAAEIQLLGCPLRAFFGADDPALMSKLPAFEDQLQRAGKDYEVRVYKDAPHAFFNDTRVSYNLDAARDSWARTLSFFADRLVSWTGGS